MNVIVRQKKAIDYVRKKGKITNKEYQKIFKVSRNTAAAAAAAAAAADLMSLVDNNIFENSGAKGAGSYYFLKK